MKRTANYLFITLIFVIQSIYSESKPKDLIKWSSYQGKKNFQEAKDQCITMKMRLPTYSELEIADEAGTTKGWQKNGSRYWAVGKISGMSEPSSKAIYLLGSSKEESHKLESQLGVYCANVTEESAGEDVIRELLENNAPENEIQKAREDIGVKKFSEYQGSLTWDDANKKCKSLKMRLPTLDELKKAYHSGIIKFWQKDGSYYWSSTPNTAGKYYGIGISDGNVDDGDRSENYDVRCHR